MINLLTVDMSRGTSSCLFVNVSGPTMQALGDKVKEVMLLSLIKRVKRHAVVSNSPSTDLCVEARMQVCVTTVRDYPNLHAECLM